VLFVGAGPRLLAFADPARRAHQPELPASRAHTADQVISIVTVLPADQPAAVAVAVVVVPGALERSVASSTR